MRVAIPKWLRWEKGSPWLIQYGLVVTRDIFLTSLARQPSDRCGITISSISFKFIERCMNTSRHSCSRSSSTVDMFYPCYTWVASRLVLYNNWLRLFYCLASIFNVNEVSLHCWSKAEWIGRCQVLLTLLSLESIRLSWLLRRPHVCRYVLFHLSFSQELLASFSVQRTSYLGYSFVRDIGPIVFVGISSFVLRRVIRPHTKAIKNRT